jgi:hypothetical protein
MRSSSNSFIGDGTSGVFNNVPRIPIAKANVIPEATMKGMLTLGQRLPERTPVLELEKESERRIEEPIPEELPGQQLQRFMCSADEQRHNRQFHDQGATQQARQRQAQEQRQILIAPERVAFVVRCQLHSISAAASNGTISS